MTRKAVLVVGIVSTSVILSIQSCFANLMVPYLQEWLTATNYVDSNELPCIIWMKACSDISGSEKDAIVCVSLNDSSYKIVAEEWLTVIGHLMACGVNFEVV